MSNRALTTTLTETLSKWKAEGRLPIEITESDAVQRVTIEYNYLTGNLTWKAERTEGIGSVAMVFHALVDMGRFFFQAPARPKLNSGAARILISFDGERIQMICDNFEDKILIRGVLIATLLKLQGEEPLSSILDFKAEQH